MRRRDYGPVTVAVMVLGDLPLTKVDGEGFRVLPDGCDCTKTCDTLIGHVDPDCQEAPSMEELEAWRQEIDERRILPHLPDDLENEVMMMPDEKCLCGNTIREEYAEYAGDHHGPECPMWTDSDFFTRKMERI